MQVPFGCFKVDAGYWYLCVRNDVILSDGDVLFVKEEDAKEQFMSMLSVPDWSKKIAPAEWGIDETEQKDISEVFSQGLDVQLEKINALRGAELAIVVVLSIAAGAWLVMFIANTFLQRKHKKTKSLPEGLRKSRQGSGKIVPAPWESMVDTTWLLDNCRNSIQSLVAISTPGWKNGGVTCSASGAVTSWKREFGRLSWIEMSLSYSGMTFTNKSIDDRGNTVTISMPFQSVKKVNSIPKKRYPS